MFQKVLAAVDSVSYRRIFDEALQVAKAHRAGLMLLHVLSPEEEASPGFYGITTLDHYPALYDELMERYKEAWSAFERQGEELLGSLVREAIAQGVTAEFTQNAGSPGRTICEVAATVDADLIVMGRRGISGLAEFFLGSASNYVLHNSPCSLMVVQEKKAPTKAD
ncbi:MAG TPA: universal stress protein [Cyanobacteria bacterium UBA8156]|jgi:nucleotide-binding universal stress UspA family protein|nr:universal stress protein [Cyanobacteria bacterium UBA8156]